MLLVTLSLVAVQLAAENSTVVSCDDHADDAHHRRLETATVPEVDEGGAHWTSRHRLERRTATIGFALAVWAGGKVVIMCSFTFVLKRDGWCEPLRGHGRVAARNAGGCWWGANNNNNNKTAAAAGLPALFGDICVGVALGPRALDFVPYPTAFVLLGELGLCLHALEVVGCGGRSCPTETHRDRVGE